MGDVMLSPQSSATQRIVEAKNRFWLLRRNLGTMDSHQFKHARKALDEFIKNQISAIKKTENAFRLMFHLHEGMNLEHDAIERPWDKETLQNIRATLAGLSHHELLSKSFGTQ